MFLLQLVVGPEEGRGIPDAVAGRLVLLDQLLKDPDIAADLRLDRLRDEVPDMRLPILAVPVDAPVALLEGQEGPGKVEVDQLVREVVQVQAFGRHVGSQQDADGPSFDAEVADQLLCLAVAVVARRVERPHLVLGELQLVTQVLAEPFERGDAFREDDDAVVLLPGRPLYLGEELGQAPVFREGLGVDCLDGVKEFREGDTVSRRARRSVCPDLREPPRQCLGASRRAGEEGLFQDGLEQPLALVARGLVLGEVQFRQDPVGCFLRLGRFERQALGVTRLDLGFDRLPDGRRRAKAAHEQTLDVVWPVTLGVGDGRRVQHPH